VITAAETVVGIARTATVEVASTGVTTETAGAAAVHHLAVVNATETTATVTATGIGAAARAARGGLSVIVVEDILVHKSRFRHAPHRLTLASNQSDRRDYDDRRDKRDDRRREYDRDERRDGGRDRDRERDDRPRDRDGRQPERARSPIPPPRVGLYFLFIVVSLLCSSYAIVANSAASGEPSPAPGSEPGEEGEDMDAVNDDDAAMMAAMGLAGFGSTKVRLLIFDMAIF
jgi:hypothetical protein